MPPSASSKRPRRSADRAREGAPRVAEELRLQQRLRERAAVLRDELPRPARPVGVDEPREQLLARAGLAEEQHRRVGVEDRAAPSATSLRSPPSAPISRSNASGRAAPRSASRRSALSATSSSSRSRAFSWASVLALGGAAHDQQERVRIPRLRHEVVDAARVDRLHQAVDVGVGGEHDAQRVGPVLLAPAQQLDARSCPACGSR